MNAKAMAIAGIGLLLFMGCKEEPPVTKSTGGVSEETNPSASSESPSLPPVYTCTLETPLKEGIAGSPGNPIPSDVNINGYSELGAMMRQMLIEMQGIRQAVMSGELPDPLPDSHARMRCVWHTDEETRTPLYDAMSIRYLQAFDSFRDGEAPIGDRYGKVVNACLDCHATTCPGPTAAIEKLKLQ